MRRICARSGAACIVKHRDRATGTCNGPGTRRTAGRSKVAVQPKASFADSARIKASPDRRTHDPTVSAGVRVFASAAARAWCRRAKDCAATARAPPGCGIQASVVGKWAIRMGKSCPARLRSQSAACNQSCPIMLTHADTASRLLQALQEKSAAGDGVGRIKTASLRPAISTHHVSERRRHTDCPAAVARVSA